MIRLIREGNYRLIETKTQTKLLILDSKERYAWIQAGGIGEILVRTFKSHIEESILATGRYRLFDVKDEPKLTDLLHLELFVGEGKWQGYLLPTGLPTDIDGKNRIIPAKEIITISTF